MVDRRHADVMWDYENSPVQDHRETRRCAHCGTNTEQECRYFEEGVFCCCLDCRGENVFAPDSLPDMT